MINLNSRQPISFKMTKITMNNYANRFEKPEELGTFLETFSPPNLNHEDIDHLNRPITRNEIEYVMKSLPTNKSQG